MASAPKQALYYMGFPSPPFPISIILLPNPTQSGLAPRQSLARAGTAQPDSIAHSLFLFISTDKLGHLVPMSTSELGVRET